MDWLKDNSWVIIMCALLVMIAVLVISIISLIEVKKVKRDISTTSLKITGALNYDSDNLAEALSITIFNNNYRDILINDFGFIYKNQQISFIEEYTERKVTKGRACVPARSSLSYKVNPLRVEKFIVGHNFRTTSIDKIYLYVCDSVGNKVIQKDKTLTKIFSTRQKARIELAKNKIHQDAVTDYMATHEGNKPFGEGVWAWFHKDNVNIPKLIKVSATFIEDSTLTPENTPNKQYNPAPIQNSDPVIEPTEEVKAEDKAVSAKAKTDTRDMKVTFIDLDVPLKAKNLAANDKKNK